MFGGSFFRTRPKTRYAPSLRIGGYGSCAQKRHHEKRDKPKRRLVRPWGEGLEESLQWCLALAVSAKVVITRGGGCVCFNLPPPHTLLHR